MAAASHDAAVRPRLTALVATVVRRPYRCEDRGYARMARAIDAVDGTELRTRLDVATRSADPGTRCGAGYVLFLLDRPELADSPRTWGGWLDSRGGECAGPPARSR